MAKITFAQIGGTNYICPLYFVEKSLENNHLKMSSIPYIPSKIRSKPVNLPKYINYF